MEDIIKEEKIENMIYEIRGKQVMLDSDLAILYECKNGTKDVNKAVKRNIKRFPTDFYFQLTKEECSRFQSGTLNIKRGQNIKYLPYVFTEQGVSMLSSVLHSNVETKIIEHDKNIKRLQESFDKLEESKEVNEIYFSGKIYDAYSKIVDIFIEAKQELIIIDRYTDKTILDMIKNLNCKVILITSEKTKITKTDIEKYNNDYHNLKIIYDDTFHDRYFIIDNNKIYHSGNSINHIGYRKSSIDVIGDKNIKKLIICDVLKIINQEI